MLTSSLPYHQQKKPTLPAYWSKNTMYPFFIALLFLACPLLILVVGIQNPKSGGNPWLAGAQSQKLIGMTQTVDWLEQTTWGLALAIGVLCLGLTYLL